MKPWETHGSGRAPDGSELVLARRDTEWVIRVGQEILMSSRMRSSEEDLAWLACDGLETGARVLIGGLGLGFTLRAVLDRVPAETEVHVSELVPEVVEWVRGPVSELSGDALSDPRVRTLVSDVREPIQAASKEWHAILLDVDNGPDALTTDSNHWLYARRGLEAARRALVPGGRLAVWSAEHDPGFERRLASARFEVERHTVRARADNKGPRHTIWVARR